MPMKNLFLVSTTLFSLLFSFSAWSSEQPSHFKGLQPSNLEEAVTNFSQFNAKLSAIIQQKELSPTDMHEVHEITYTLENALEKISSELDILEDTLEAVHLASERADTTTVQTQGKAYLDNAKKLIP